MVGKEGKLWSVCKVNNNLKEKKQTNKVVLRIPVNGTNLANNLKHLQ